MMTQLRNEALEELIEELARVLWDPDQAKALVLRAGFPPCDVPAFDVATAFWSRVVREAADGKLPGGVQPILDEAASRFPGNTFLAAYRAKGAVGARAREPRREHARRPTAPSPPTVPLPKGGRMPSWSSLLQGVVLAGLAASGVTLGPSWWKTNVESLRPDVASVEIAPVGAVASMDMIAPVRAIERVEDVDTAKALVTANDPAVIRSDEEPSKREGNGDAAPDGARVDAETNVESSSKGSCVLESSTCSPSPKNDGRSSSSSRSKAIQTSSEELDIDLPEVGAAPIDLAFSKGEVEEPMAADCPLDPTKCNHPKAIGAPSSAPTSTGSTEPGASGKRSYADIEAAINAHLGSVKACGPLHGAEHGEELHIEFEIDGTTGTVLSAVQEPHADTLLGSCIEAVFANIEVIRFKRSKHVVGYTIKM